jgi:hypothetical protein
MTTTRRTAIWVGILFIAGYVSVFVASAVYDPIVSSADYLREVHPNRVRVVVGMLLALINDVAVAGIAIMLYPIVKGHSVTIAIGYLAFRLIEATMLVIGKLGILPLVELSEAFLATGGDAAQFALLGAQVQALGHWADQLQSVFYILAAFILYRALLVMRIVPRWIPLWGIFALALMAVGQGLGVPPPTGDFQPEMLLFLPVFLSELFLAFWLIAKGFTTPRAPGEDNG